MNNSGTNSLLLCDYQKEAKDSELVFPLEVVDSQFSHNHTMKFLTQEFKKTSSSKEISFKIISLTDVDDEVYDLDLKTTMKLDSPKSDIDKYYFEYIVEIKHRLQNNKRIKYLISGNYFYRNSILILSIVPINPTKDLNLMKSISFSFYDKHFEQKKHRFISKLKALSQKQSRQ